MDAIGFVLATRRQVELAPFAKGNYIGLFVPAVGDRTQPFRHPPHIPVAGWSVNYENGREGQLAEALPHIAQAL